MWTTTAPQLEIPSDPSTSGESKSYEIQRRAPQSIYVFRTTEYRLLTTDYYRLQTADYRLQTADYRLQTLTSEALNFTYKHTNVYCIFWILDTNLIWPSRGKDVSPGPD